ncbi:YggS family pyridoxal phosphate-dependent enzyme [Paenibacillus yanchengensis]|uniref:Pyridoxal phosphate homeostasis protein n=1 Tax=Paenibacillus yanchengensis TaxID=2035833 RepID=A0ABW4YKL6_9BACL
MLIAAKLEQVSKRIADACERAHRHPSEINVIAVTKYVALTRAQEALDNGIVHLGENRWQDAKEKWEQLPLSSAVSSDKPIWHFIGSLQSNKAKDVVGKFDYIHSLDRLSLAKAIDKQAEQLDIVVPCFIQVNVSQELTKQGIMEGQVYDFLNELKNYRHIKPIGLMTMAPFEVEPEATRPVFRKLRQWRDDIQNRSDGTSSITELSMGMSNDFEVAIEEGATWIRLGTILVGEKEE